MKKRNADTEFTASSIERAWEPAEEVVVPYALAYSPDLQPEDYGVLIRLLLRDPDQPSGLLALAEEFQVSGWKMGASRLRGVIGRLQKAGHVSHEQNGYDEETKRPKWKFRVYRNPANNSAYVNRGTAEASQVSPMVRNPTRRGPKAGSDDAISNICAGQTDGAISNTSAADGAISDVLENNICAGQTDGAISNTSAPLVPHLQEEVTTSSPNPLTNTSGRGPAAPGEEEVAAVAFTADELAAASHLLQLLPQPWSQGRPKAKRLAPRLLAVMADQGWPKILELSETDRLLLVRQLAKNPEKVNNYGSVLATDRIPNLPLYVTCRRPAVIRPRSGAPAAGSAGHCGDIDCDPITRTRESRDEAGLLRLHNCPQCHPSAPRASAG